MLMLHGRLAAVPARRDELLGILLENSDSDSMPGCRLYLVALDEEDPDGVWVTEVWESEEAHTASLQVEQVRERIARAMPLIDRSGLRQQRLDPRGGVPAAGA
jgi:quinol monooxygenase YgiN